MSALKAGAVPDTILAPPLREATGGPGSLPGGNAPKRKAASGGTGGPGSLPGGNASKPKREPRKQGKSGGSSSWDESKHPRGATGTSKGGKFVSKGSLGKEAAAVNERLGVKGKKFGDASKKAVEAFQKKRGLKVDGIVGTQTVAALKGAKGAKSAKPGSLSDTDIKYLRKGAPKGKSKGKSKVKESLILVERDYARWPRGTPISGAVGGGRFAPRAGGGGSPSGSGFLSRTSRHNRKRSLSVRVDTGGGTIASRSKSETVDEVTRRAAPVDDTERRLLHKEWDHLGVEAQLYAAEERQDDPRLRGIVERQRLIQKRLHYGRLFEQRPPPPSQRLTRERGEETRDIVVVGGGPAGLTSAVHGAYEGLDVLLLEGSDRAGGQSARSARLENVYGMDRGVKGSDLAKKGLRQAERYGAQVEFNARVTGLQQTGDGDKIVTLEDGRTVKAHNVVVATGLSFSKLDVPELEGSNVVYGDSAKLKEQTMVGDPVLVVGGGNSAGQAALDLAGSGRPVTMLVRSNLAKGMSDKLLRQLRAAKGITVLEGAELERAHRAGDRVTGATLKDGRKLDARGIGLYIGQGPSKPLGDLATDERGFLRVGEGDNPLETTMPGVFAPGDSRVGKMGRVQAAAGEGAVVVAEVTKRIDQLRRVARQAA
jgi:thioredoxin reductase/peptidoglycan hydrolase-like protein with peptidoglycan-binding domain